MLGQILLEAAGATGATTTAITKWGEATDATLQGLLFLLPGLVTVAIIHSLTVKQKQEPLERIIQALLYTFINHVTWEILLLGVNIILFTATLGHVWWQPSPRAQLIGLGFLAVLWGLVSTWVINIGWLHDRLRDLEWVNKWLSPCLKFFKLNKLASALTMPMCFGLTKRSSRPSEWYDAFYDNDDKYVVLHLKDKRRIFGWANLYPDLPTEGHLLVRDAEWLHDTPPAPPACDSEALFAPTESKPAQSTPAPLMDILVNVVDVKFIEFVRIPKEAASGSEPDQVGSTQQADDQEGRREREANRPAPDTATTAASTQEVILQGSADGNGDSHG